MWIDYKKAYDVALQSWIVDFLKTYKISSKVIKFITEAMKNWKAELTVGGNTLAEVKIKRHLLGSCAVLITICNSYDATQLHRKCTKGYKFTKLQEKMNHLMYMEDKKLFAKYEKE